jgi:hypothetical protein
MKASILPLIVLTLLSPITFGQNYQTIRSNEIHYYTTQNYDYVLASKVSSVELVGTDSVFRSFQTIREHEGLAENDPCKYYLGDSWMGSKMVIKANGQNVFYNHLNESITIETQAVLGDIFDVYTYPSGDWIKGEVTNHIEMSIFGDMDSIKIITLFSNVPLNLVNPKIIISENYGFIELFAPYSFPEPYIGPSSLNNDHDFPIGYDENFLLIGFNETGLTKPTIGDVFDYGIGDNILTYSSIEDLEGNITEVTKERKVVNKFSWSQDSVEYFVNDLASITYYPTTGEPTTILSGEGTTTVNYNHLNQWNTPFLPEEFDGIDGWTSLYINECHDLQEVVRKQGFIFTGIDSCLQVNPYGANLMFTTINGVGWLDPVGQSQAGSEFYQAELLYYDKADGSACGSITSLGIDLQEQEKPKVYPNPAESFVNIETNPNNQVNRISIIDSGGRTVSVWDQFESNQHTLDLTDLSTGVYTLIIEDDNQIQQQSLVKR